MPDSFEGALSYNARVRALFVERERAGALPRTEYVVSGEAGSVAQGTHLRFWLEWEAGSVRRARFEAYACPHLLASAAYVASWAEGKTVPQLLAWDWRPLAESLQAPVEKSGKFLILEDALKAAARESDATQFT
jgi:NifU-like protein involved in Fe-S cluster formation